MPDSTPLSRLTAALPATHDGPIGVHSADLRAVLDALIEAKAILAELADDCGPNLHPEWGDCYWCEDNYEDLTNKPASDHGEGCTWRKACEYLDRYGRPAVTVSETPS
jgi:hypothetical protein